MSLDYIASAYTGSKDARQLLINQHLAHSFSGKYKDMCLLNYLEDLQVEVLTQLDRQPGAARFSEVSDSFISFFAIL